MNEHDRDLATIAAYMRERGESTVPSALLAQVRDRAMQPESLRRRSANTRSASWARGATAMVGGLASVAALVVLVAVVAGLPPSVAQGPVSGDSPSSNGTSTPSSPPAAPSTAPSSPRPGSPLPITGTWELPAGSIDGRTVPMVDSYPITLVISEDSVSGTSACNGYGAILSPLGGSFRVAGIGGTDMACAEEVMASETAYLAALGRVTTATLESDELFLEGDGVELRFRPLASPPIGELTDTTWNLETLTTGLTATGAQGDVTLRLDSNGTLTGSTGCRTLRGRYVVVGGEILATRLAADGDCSAALADQDGHIVSVLGDGFRAAVEGDRFLLTSTGEQGLIYRLETSASATPRPAPSVFQGGIPETSDHVSMLLLERTSREMCITTVEIDYDEVGLRQRALELAEDAGPGPRRLAPDLYLGSLEEAIDGFRGTELLAVTGGYHWVWYLARPQDAERWNDDPLPELAAAVLLRVELPDGREVWWRNGAYIAVRPCD